jgi:hypothetical protein
VNNTFAKTALAAGVLAGLGYADASMALSLVPNTNDVVVLGCSVPSAGTTVATVYSIDAVSTGGSTYTISLPTAVAVGQSCTAAISALETSPVVAGVYFVPAAGNAQPTVQAIPGTGYTLQQFNFTAAASPVGATSQVAGFVGCAAPSSAGATVYSVDSGTAPAATTITAVNALVGKPCSWAVAKANSAAGTGFGAGSLLGETVLNINSNGYSLNQYTFN